MNGMNGSKYTSFKEYMDEIANSHQCAVVYDGKLVPEIPEGVERLPFIASEENKSKKGAEAIETFLFTCGLLRSDLVVAVGGGVVLDVTGFAASIYKRGITLHAVPTTLLAIVDASIGGKTGINTRWGKNTLGTFHLPERTIIDLDFLKTLPDAEFRSGLMEIYKIALLYSPALYGILTKWRPGFTPDLEYVIRTARTLKEEACRKDPFDRGERGRLNFGHTLGHALEEVSGYSLTHGDCIAYGMLFDLFPGKDEQLVHELFRWGGISFPLPFTARELWKPMQHDKKRTGSDVDFVSPSRSFTLSFPAFEKAYYEWNRIYTYSSV
ncbi:MAG: hypothetical protein A3F09_00285 [Chlamydiae bacterium RIFCSPHIGHO2_12_FULL_49_11]|nr:MAG: hypothetical protein A3F09_00285 [Chlamydiae bacterium RIFCSPHIGHO2_12_FULL_49_11]